MAMQSPVEKLVEELTRLHAEEASLRTRMRAIRARIKATERALDREESRKATQDLTATLAKRSTPKKRSRKASPASAAASSSSSSSSEDESEEESGPAVETVAPEAVVLAVATVEPDGDTAEVMAPSSLTPPNAEAPAGGMKPLPPPQTPWRHPNGKAGVDS